MNTLRILAICSLFFSAVAAINAQSVTTGTPRGAAVYATYAAKPDYPYLARVHHIQGSGVFALRITADGKVSGADAVQSTGNKDLDNSALTAFRKWRFRPPGKPTKVEIPVTWVMVPGAERSHPLHPTRSE